MHHIKSYAALQALVGAELGVSDWLQITQQRINLFAEATGDKQWIHVDEARAKRESPYGGTIAHGHLTMALAPTLLAQIIRVDARLIVNPGLERMRLRQPVRSGQRVRMRATLKALRKLPGGGGARATLHTRFEIQGESKPAASGEMLLLYFL